MEKSNIYDAIVSWEYKAGESFLDQGFDLHPLTFMTWCLGKGYLSKEKYDKWVIAYQKNKIEAIDANYFVYCPKDLYGEDAPFAVIISSEWNLKDQEKAYRILSEFISEIDLYLKRLKDYISED